MIDGYKWRENLAVLKKYGLNKDEYFVWAGRLVPDNNLDILLDAYEKAKTNRKLIIIGSDHYKTSYLEKIKKQTNKNKNIILTGFIPRDQYLTLIKNSYAHLETKQSGGLHPTLLDSFKNARRIICNNNRANLLVTKMADVTVYSSINELKILLSKKNLRAKKRRKHENYFGKK